MPENIPYQVGKWLVGDDSAFKPIFAYYYPAVKRYALRCFKSDTWAEDIAIEVLTKIWEKRTVIQADTFENYLFTIARNKVLNYWERKIDLLLSLDTQEEVITNSDAYDPLLQKELEKIYKEGIDELPAQRRTVFMLHRNEQLNYRQIADKLNISPKTVESQMGLALKHLRAAMMRYLTSIL